MSETNHHIVLPEIKPSTEDARILDPLLYQKSAELFLNHFKLGCRRPDLDFLGEILLYYSRIPYENLSKIIKHKDQSLWMNKLRLPEEVMDDHARFHLGGTCFSLAFALETILTRLGFICYPVMADMKWKSNSHCVLIVLWEGDKYLVDPGYLLNQAMRLNPEKPRLYNSEVSGIEVVFRSPEIGYEVYTFHMNEMKWRYRFRDIVCTRADFLKYWLDSFHWNSMHGLLLTRIEKGRMVYIHKHFMRETSLTQKKNHNIKKNYHTMIGEYFQIRPELVEQALSALKINMARERGIVLET